MGRTGLVLVLAVGILSTSACGYQLPGRQTLSKTVDKASNFVGKQKQNDFLLNIPDNAYAVENSHILFPCHQDGLFAYPQDCTLGVRCWGGEARVFTCTDVLHFNNVSKACESFCSAHCDPLLACPCGWDSCETSKSIVEESATDKVAVNREEITLTCIKDGLYPDPMDCNQFIQCSNDRAFFMKCPSGLHFSRETERCESPEDAACDRNRRTPRTENDQWNAFRCSPNGYYGSAENCNYYYECLNGRYIFHTCPPGEHFSIRRRRCDTPCNARCDRSISCPRRRQRPRQRSESLSTEIPIAKHVTLYKTSEKFFKLKSAFVCSDDGLYPNPEDCSKYINCINGNANELSCPPSRHFNNETKQCETLCSAKCDPNVDCNWWDSMKRYEELYLEICSTKYNTEKLYYVVHPNRCSTYYKCEVRDMNKFRCPDGQHFSRETSRCEEPCDARCDRSLEETCGFEVSTERLMESLEDQCANEKKNFSYRYFPECKFYFKCVSGEISVVRCSNGQHLYKKTLRCEEPCVARCDSSLAERCGWGNETTESEIVPTQMSPREDNETGEFDEDNPRIVYTCHHGDFYPDHERCNIFYECLYGKMVTNICFPGYHYNRRTKKCDAPCNAKCDPSISQQCGWERTRAFEIALPDTLMIDEPDVTLTPLKSSRELCSKDGTYLERNPLDCNTYFKCMDGDADLLYCPDGQHFHQQTLRCEEGYDAHCDSTMASSRTLTKHEPDVTLTQLKSSKMLCSVEGTYYERNPLNCKTYIKCTVDQPGWMAISLLHCPDGQHFNQLTSECDDPCDAHCDPTMAEMCGWRWKYTTESNKLLSNSLKQPVFDFECPGNGLYANTACESFIQCTGGQAYLIDCPYGQHYDPNSERCTTPCEARCDPNYEEYCRDEEKQRAPKQHLKDGHEWICQTDGFHANPPDCGSYILCVGGDAYYIYCPADHHYSPTLEKCVSRCDAKCAPNYEEYCKAEEWNRGRKLEHPHSSSAKQPFPLVSDEFLCYNDGDYPNPENCNSYITCKLGESFYKDCPEGLHFNEKTESCESPCVARCDSKLACFCDWDTCDEVMETSDEIDCEAEIDEGHCRGNSPRYAYDAWSGRCRAFVFRGCGGNTNNFRTLAECENKCQKKLLRGYRCPADTGMFGHYPDCLSYYHCKRGIPTLKRCPKGKAFDHKKSKCVKEHEATCVYECRDRDAVYPYEDDCRKYIDCVNGISKLERCPTGKAFDPDVKDCIDERQVETCFWE